MNAKHLLRLVERHMERFDDELAEMRDGFVSLDHRIAAVRQEVTALDDQLSVLRNDYRGEKT